MLFSVVPVLSKSSLRRRAGIWSGPEALLGFRPDSSFSMTSSLMARSGLGDSLVLLVWGRQSLVCLLWRPRQTVGLVLLPSQLSRPWAFHQTWGGLLLWCLAFVTYSYARSAYCRRFLDPLVGCHLCSSSDLCVVRHGWHFGVRCTFLDALYFRLWLCYSTSFSSGTFSWFQISSKVGYFLYWIALME